MENRKRLLLQLDDTVAQLLDIFRADNDPSVPVYKGWSARDVLGHVVFWHESFARNVDDLVTGFKPEPLKGRFLELNQQGVEQMRTCSLDQVLKKLEDAQRTIQKNILDPDLTLIPYKKGSRDYTPEEHLDVVNRHVNEHLHDIKRAFKIL